MLATALVVEPLLVGVLLTGAPLAGELAVIVGALLGGLAPLETLVGLPLGGVLFFGPLLVDVPPVGLPLDEPPVGLLPGGVPLLPPELHEHGVCPWVPAAT